MQVENKQPEVLTEDHFAQARKRQLSQKLSKDEVLLIKKNCIGQPVWPQNLSSEDSQQGSFWC